MAGSGNAGGVNAQATGNTGLADGATYDWRGKRSSSRQRCSGAYV